MQKPYDPTLKTLVEISPSDWLPLAKRRRCRVTIEDSDIGTLVSGATDKLFRVHDRPEYMLHLDFESGHFRADLPSRLRLFNSVFEYRHRRPVLSVPVLLSPAADSPRWNGLLESGLPGEVPFGTLRYQVIRVWELSADQLLAGGIGTMVLAPVSDVAQHEVRTVIQRIRERLTGPKRPKRAADLWAATYVLLGLRYSEEFAHALFSEVLGMEESTTYQAIVRRGRAEEARRLLLLQGQKKFGDPRPADRAVIEGLNDVAQLEELGIRLVTADSWKELLPTVGGRRRSKP